jgi:PiT family inorganic phosphate transporter
VHGFASHIASSLVVLGAALTGGPVSATQVIGSSIMGVGSAERISKVRWDVAREMLVAWGLTIPAAMVLGAGAMWGMRTLGF